VLAGKPQPQSKDPRRDRDPGDGAGSSRRRNAMSEQFIHGSSNQGGAGALLGKVGRRIARVLVYVWASPTTMVGLIAAGAALVSGGSAQVVDGVLEVHGGLVTFLLARCTPLRGGASAMTLGHVVIGRDPQLLEATRRHERVHVRQCERWGPLFVPAYFAASVVAWASGKRAYMDNCFEREAYGRDE